MRLLLSLGPTLEAIDGVRFLSNRSSGRLGIAIAQAALKRGHTIVAVHGPLQVPPPRGGRWIAVESAREMLAALGNEFPNSDALVMAAAVCDVRPVAAVAGKLEKSELKNLKLEPNPDIVATLAARRTRQLLVAFSLGATLDAEKARAKLEAKGADWIAWNALPSMGSASGVYGILARGGEVLLQPRELSKARFASRLVQLMETQLAKKRQ